MAAILFKNTIINATNVSLGLKIANSLFAQEDDGKNFWFNFDQELRDFIKQALLALLIHDNSNVVKDAGLCLAIIATVELPFD